MQSAEASGVGARTVDSRSSLPRVITSVSPLTYAIALTAFLAATLFVVADAIRSFADLTQRQAIVADLGRAQPLLARQFAAHSLDPVIGNTDSASVVAGVAQR